MPTGYPDKADPYGEPADWERQQIKTFTAWVNMYLSRSKEVRRALRAALCRIAVHVTCLGGRGQYCPYSRCHPVCRSRPSRSW